MTFSINDYDFIEHFWYGIKQINKYFYIIISESYPICILQKQH